MALIRCPECDKEVSSEARVCPHCGYPLRKEPIKCGYSEQQIKTFQYQLTSLKQSLISFAIFGLVSLVITISAVIIGIIYNLMVCEIIAIISGTLTIIFLLVLCPIVKTRIVNRNRAISEYKATHPESED